MSIIDTFDLFGKEILKASDKLKKIDDFPKTVIVVFSAKFCSLFLKKHNAQEIGYLSGGGLSHPIYKFEYKGAEIGFFTTVMGGAGSSAYLEELIALGGERFLFFGSCGALDKDIAEGNLLVPTSAYRDEGVSYHYAEASDYLEIKSAPKLTKILDDMHIPYKTTKTWTTDAFYRETDRNMDLRKKEGCGIVEMECASIMSVGQFRHKEVYQFLYAADCLDGSTWDSRILGNVPQDMRERLLVVAVEIAFRLSSQE
ncbi:MAG: nucleoside phosphorylase [Clostridia bacterium]|nr:nucleoside phosphorylase [Clostridia bacterium]